MIRAEHNWEDEELELFRAGRTEGPAPGSADGVLAALGLGGPVGPGPETPAEAPPVSQVGPLSSPESMAPLPPPVPASGIFAKPLPWIGAGGILLALIPAAMLLGNDSQETASAPTQETPEETRPAGDGSSYGQQAGPEGEASDAGEGDAIKLSDLEDAEIEGRAADGATASARAAKDRRQTAPQETSQRPSLAEELAIIKLARSKLNAGDLAGAQAALAEHQKKFSPPRLASEARVIRVEILVKQGKMAEARALAAPLMKENSPYRARMETLLSSR